ncbi:GyrI-like domain-containing protein [Neobacillus sp. D3-1R]|uniref:GyrI-like domain-containing protein n=1 Tax=Neobacillus sp. D3-1R TaxID=3445778 RepID=UPI003FA0C9A4
MSKTQRFLELMDRVKQKRSFTVQELADEFHVSYRTMWRYLQELSTLGIALYSEPGSNGGYRILEEKHSAPIEIIFKPKTTYVGFTFDAPYIAKQETEILAPRLWLQLLSRLSEIKNLKYPIQKVALAKYRKEDFSYFITVEVNKRESDSVPPGMTEITVPATTYAVKTHVKTLELDQVIQTYEEIYRWISRNGFEKLDQDYHLEAYGEKFRPNAPQTNFEIYVPIQKFK